jgi:hypothetical protein
MSISTLDQLKAAFGKADKNEGGGSRPNNYYPFWNMPENSQAVIRFLPDKNEENPLGFLVEKRMHTLTINGENKSVPCLTMYGEECPICKVSGDFYKQEDKVQGKKYWRKKQHIAQAIVVDDPLPPDDETGENHEGKVRFIALGYQLFNIIKEAFESGELDEIPYAYQGGTDFIIKKSKQGEYSTYALGSKFARKSRDLSDDEIALAQENMVDLSTLLPQAPEEAKIHAMLEAALNGGEYVEHESADEGLAFKPKAASKPAATPAPAKAEESEEDSSDGDAEADKILAAIRSRRANKAE